ncbi:hypothetical protein FIV53_00140 [Mycoplasma nasistruthionis]|uniref:F5/8 type C domain-containing protein n=1 Tax=Mycoplasma nasistruthionis TaxID=353852 RepID=A0A4Y6I761_9MOLU|nr:hypothetical protein FIV53_00140 [Mycoplasma nasistruthionis]
MFSGKAIVIIESNLTEGPITISASSSGLQSDQTTIYSIKNINPDSKNIKYVQLENYNGFTNSELNLPTEITVILENGTEAKKTITWNTENVNLAQAGEYQISFSLDNKTYKTLLSLKDFGSSFKVPDYFFTVSEQQLNNETELNSLLPTHVNATDGINAEFLESAWETTYRILNNNKKEVLGKLKKYPEIKFKATFISKPKGSIIDLNTNTLPTGTTVVASYASAGDQANNVLTNHPNHDRRWTNWTQNNTATTQQDTLTFTLPAKQLISAVGFNLFKDLNTNQEGPLEVLVSTSEDGNSFTEVSNQNKKTNFKAEESKEHIIRFDEVNTKFIRLTIKNREKNTNNGQKQYWVNGLLRFRTFSKTNSLLKETDNKLTKIYANGSLINGFNPDKNTYDINVESTQNWPELTFAVDSSTGAQYSVVSTEKDNKKIYTIFVYAEDGSVNKYFVNLIKEYSTIKSVDLKSYFIPVGMAQKPELTINLENDIKLDISEVSNLRIVAENNEKINHISFYNNYLLAHSLGTERIKFMFEYKEKTYESNYQDYKVIENILNPQILNVSPIILNTEINQPIDLPDKLNVRYDNEDFDRTYDILWEYPSVEFDQPGVYSINGTLASNNTDIFATINVKGLSYVNDLYLNAVTDFKPLLPTTVTGFNNFNEPMEVEVVWDSIDSLDFSHSGITHTVNGKVKNTELSIKAFITVSTKRDEFNISKQATGFDYPAAFSGFSNDRNGNRDFVGNLNDGIDNKWTDWNPSKRVNENYVGVLFARGGLIGAESFNNLTIKFGSDNASNKPKAYQIQYLKVKPTEIPSAGQLPHLFETNSILNDENAWTNVEMLNSPNMNALTPGMSEDITFRFKPVTGYAIRIKMTHQDGHGGLGILIKELTVNSPIPNVASDFTVNSIKVDNQAIENFETNKFEYELTLKQRQLPEIMFETNGSVKVSKTLNGNKLIYTVSSQDNSKVQKYTFNLYYGNKEVKSMLIEQLKEQLPKLFALDPNKNLLLYSRGQSLIREINYIVNDIFTHQNELNLVLQEVKEVLQ